MPKPPLLHEKIRAMRKAAGLSQKQAAARAGLARTSWVNYESPRERYANPSLAVLRQIARALGVSVSALLEGVRDPAGN